MFLLTLRLACTSALVAGALFAPSARAADVPQQMIDGNASVCQQMAAQPATAKFDPLLPADAAKVPAYCACVSKAYWSSVPQADFDGMLGEMRQFGPRDAMQQPHSKAIHDALKGRMTAARKSCH
ncbi:MAG TPA: hypothetical protein VF457_09650 [Burkholderiaceae bacterium]